MKTGLIAAAVAALIPLAGIAGEGSKSDKASMPAASAGERIPFDALDSNKDGRISLPEASADPRLVEGFSSADKNGDGYLDSTEYANSTKKQ